MNEERINLEKDVWYLIKSFSQTFPPDAIQINAYNDFVENKFRNILNENGSFTYEKNNKKYTVELYNPNYIMPYHNETEELKRVIFPVEACERGMNYMSDVLCTMKITSDSGEEECVKIYDNVFIGKIPVMVGSALCNLTHNNNDPNDIRETRECLSGIGGYFIVNGSKKCVIAQERSSFNKICVFENCKKPSYTHYAQVRSSATSTTHTSIINVGIEKSDLISIHTPYINDDTTIPIIILFKALGVKSSQDIVDSIINSQDEAYSKFLNILLPSFEIAYHVKSQEDALFYIGNKVKKYTITQKKEAIEFSMKMLTNDILPTFSDNFCHKRFYIGWMIREFLDVYFGRKKVEDRDLYSNKRVDCVNILLSNLLYTSLKKLLVSMRNSYENHGGKANFKYIDHVDPKHITKIFTNALSNGKWGGKKVQSDKKTGISQTYEQFNFQMRIANIRRLTAPISIDGKIQVPRHLHGSHWGIVDPFDTPEGDDVGLDKIFSILVQVTFDKDIEPIVEILKIHGVKEININDTKVVINGTWIKSCTNPVDIVDALRKMKRDCSISPDTSIVYDSATNEMRICTDSGRIIRPYIVVEDGKLLLTRKDINDIVKYKMRWEEIMSKGYMEYLDPEEIDHSKLCESLDYFYECSHEERKTYTHCDVHPTTILGTSSATIKYVERNQAPRNAYQCNMCKQSVGIPYTNFQVLMCGTCHVLNYSQRPVISTKLEKMILHYDEMPSGINAIAAICPYLGINQEDSIILNKDSVDRGLFVSSKYITYEESVMKHKNEYFGIPNREDFKIFHGDIRNLDEDGCVGVGCIVKKGDILIGKIRDLRDLKNDSKNKDEAKLNLSLVLKDCETAIVSQVQRGYNSKNYEYIRIQIIETRIPEQGDKFASCIAQKGTTGQLIPSADLPFCPNGMCAPYPDIIYNPLCFPSRMTNSQLVEMLMATKCTGAYTKNFNNKDEKTAYSPLHTNGLCSSFEHLDLDSIYSTMKEMGFHPKGKVKMIDGITGKQIESLIFMGPVYIQRLRHQSRDKIHARSRGPMQILSRQPTEGRSKNGGLRIGEMERDCLIGQGLVEVIRDRLLINSDAFKCYVCRYCGLIAIVNPKNKLYECTSCETNEVRMINITYGIKSVIQELISINIIPRIIIDDKNDSFIVCKPK